MAIPSFRPNQGQPIQSGKGQITKETVEEYLKNYKKETMKKVVTEALKSTQTPKIAIAMEVGKEYKALDTKLKEVAASDFEVIKTKFKETLQQVTQDSAQELGKLKIENFKQDAVKKLNANLANSEIPIGDNDQLEEVLKIELKKVLPELQTLIADLKKSFPELKVDIPTTMRRIRDICLQDNKF